MGSARLHVTLMVALGGLLAGAMALASEGRGSRRAREGPTGAAPASQEGPAAPPPASPDEEDAPDAFPPLPKPGANDWLANHPEPGQTLAEFEEADRPLVTEKRRTLRLQPLDPQAT